MDRGELSNFPLGIAELEQTTTAPTITTGSQRSKRGLICYYTAANELYHVTIVDYICLDTKELTLQYILVCIMCDMTSIVY